MNAEQAKQLRDPFPKEAIGKLPKGGVMLDYVGHAAVTDRLLIVDPAWHWEPVAFDARDLPCLDEHGGLWIRLTVLDVTKLGYGDAGGKKGPNAVKEAIGDAIRNAAMRFGVALDLWAKEDLSVQHDPLRKVRDKVWELSKRRGWSSEDLAQDFAKENNGELIQNATVDQLELYAKVLEQDAA